MNRDHTGDQRQFWIASEAYWHNAMSFRKGIVEEVCFGLYCPDGGTSGEMVMRWHQFSDRAIAPRLECYHDAWSALGTFRDVLDRLAELDSENVTPAQFCDLLKACGFTNRTQRRQKPKPEPKRDIRTATAKLLQRLELAREAQPEVWEQFASPELTEAWWIAKEQVFQ